jgi:hypothetical protein
MKTFFLKTKLLTPEFWILDSCFKSIFLIPFCLLSFIVAKAQDTTKHVSNPAYDTAIHITEAPGVSHTMQKKLEYARLSHGVFPGYRIQVSFGQNRNDANKLRSDFSGKFPALPTYLTYSQPYFKIYAGDFRTKLEAVKYLAQVKKDYPGAFVVKDKINQPPLAN